MVVEYKCEDNVLCGQRSVGLKNVLTDLTNVVVITVFIRPLSVTRNVLLLCGICEKMRMEIVDLWKLIKMHQSVSSPRKGLCF